MKACILHGPNAEKSVIERAFKALKAHGAEAWEGDRDGPMNAITSRLKDTGLVLTLGGDGTFLAGARVAAPRGIPLLGVNLGRLGFLTEIDAQELEKGLERFFKGDYRIEERNVLQSTLKRDGKNIAQAIGLNEAVINRAGEARMLRVEIDVGGQPVGVIDADGVMVATATGSTAYALSAGGPPVDPRVRALVVVPLAAHAVITRPVVLPEAVSIDLTVLWGRGFAGADGHVEAPLSPGSRLEIRPGPELQVVQIGAMPFVRRLREKVRFGMPLKEAHDAPDGHRVHERQAVDADGPAATDVGAASEGG